VGARSGHEREDDREGVPAGGGIERDQAGREQRSGGDRADPADRAQPLHVGGGAHHEQGGGGRPADVLEAGEEADRRGGRPGRAEPDAVAERRRLRSRPWPRGGRSHGPEHGHQAGVRRAGEDECGDRGALAGVVVAEPHADHRERQRHHELAHAAAGGEPRAGGSEHEDGEDGEDRQAGERGAQEDGQADEQAQDGSTRRPRRVGGRPTISAGRTPTASAAPRAGSSSAATAAGTAQTAPSAAADQSHPTAGAVSMAPDDMRGPPDVIRVVPEGWAQPG